MNLFGQCYQQCIISKFTLLTGYPFSWHANQMCLTPQLVRKKKINPISIFHWGCESSALWHLCNSIDITSVTWLLIKVTMNLEVQNVSKHYNLQLPENIVHFFLWNWLFTIICFSFSMFGHNWPNIQLISKNFSLIGLTNLEEWLMTLQYLVPGFGLRLGFMLLWVMRTSLKSNQFNV